MSRPQSAARYSWLDLLGSAQTYTGKPTFSGGLVAGGTKLEATTNTIEGQHASYLAMIMDTNTKTTHLCGGPGAAAASGAFVSCFGNAHATTPGRMNIVPGSAGEVNLYNNATTLALTIASAGAGFPLAAQFTNTTTAFTCTEQTTAQAVLAPNTLIGEYSTSGWSYLTFGAGGGSSNVGMYIRTRSGGSANNAIVANYNTASLLLTAYYLSWDSQVVNTDGTLGTYNSNITFAWGHMGVPIYHSSGTHTWTIPTNATTAFPVGTRFRLINAAGGTVTLARSTGVQLISVGNGAYVSNADKTLATGYTYELYKYSTDAWMVMHSGGCT